VVTFRCQCVSVMFDVCVGTSMVILSFQIPIFKQVSYHGYIDSNFFTDCVRKVLF
jgi:hypothetical protein